MNLTMSSSAQWSSLCWKQSHLCMGRDWGGGQMITKAGQDLDCALRRRAENEKTAINDKKISDELGGRNYKDANHLVCAVSLFGMKLPRKKIRGGDFHLIQDRGSKMS